MVNEAAALLDRRVTQVTPAALFNRRLQNAEKCLKAGFNHVAMIAVSADRLAKLKQSVDACLGAALAARVGYFTPNEFILHLQGLAAEDSKPPPPIAPGEKIYGKYKVKSKSVPLTPAEAQEREDQACRVIAETMRQSKGA